MRTTLKKFLLTSVAIACALPVVARETNAPAVRGGQIGQLEEARKVVGSEIKNAQNQALGKIQDVVVDLESGRILYTVVSINGQTDRIALPPTSFTVQGAPNARTHILNIDRDKLNSAPKFTADKESQLSDISFASEVYKFGATPAWWEGANAGGQAAGSFNNVHKVTALFDHAVKDVNNADLGKVDDVVLDLHDARVPFVLLKREQGGRARTDYAIPPNAFTLSADKQTLTTGIDQNMLNSAPRFARGNLNALANRATALGIYKHYGKQPYFSELSPTSDRTNTTVYPLRAGQIGQFEEARKIVGSEIKNTQNQALGKIEDAVVDLESGRILYTVASINGQADRIALPPTSFTVQGGPNARSHILNIDRDKLNSAPKFTADKEGQLGNVSFASEVYKFGATPAWWEGANVGAQAAGSFNNVHKVTALFDHAVKDVNNADLGKVDDVVLDLHDARVPFVILKREQGGRQAGMDYAIPPNAFTLSADKQTLATGIDQNTLNSAPRLAKGNLNSLANRTTALAIYKHYGKQPYFSELSPTSERTNTYVYPLK